MGVVMTRHPFKYVLVVVTSVFITFPVIDRVTPGLQIQSLHRLTKGEVGISAVGAKLDQSARLQSFDQPERKRPMIEPGRLFDVLGRPKRKRRAARQRPAMEVRT